MNAASSTNSRRVNGNNKANVARPNNQVIPVANTAQSDIDFSGLLIGSNFNSNSSNNNNSSTGAGGDDDSGSAVSSAATAIIIKLKNLYNF